MTQSLIPLPEPLALPAPVWVVWALLLLTFVLHIVAMNLLLGGSVLAVHARLRRSTNVHARALVAEFARFAPVLITATVTLGVAPLLFLQLMYGRVFFVSSILMAWWWLAVIPALIAAYAAAYRRAFQASSGGQTSAWLHVASAGLLLGIALVYTSNMTLMLRVADFRDLFRASASGSYLNVGDPVVWARWLHMVLGAVAVAGLGAAIAGVTRRSTRPDCAAWVCRYGASWSAVATMTNVAVGLLWVGALPASVRSTLVGPTIPGMLLAVSVISGLATIMLLVQLAQRISPVLAAAATTSMGVTIVGMVLTRDALRTLILARAGFLSTTWIVPQWVPMGLFALFLVAALAIVGWMIVTLRRSAIAERTTLRSAS